MEKNLENVKFKSARNFRNKFKMCLENQLKETFRQKNIKTAKPHINQTKTEETTKDKSKEDDKNQSNPHQNLINKLSYSKLQRPRSSKVLKKKELEVCTEAIKKENKKEIEKEKEKEKNYNCYSATNTSSKGKKLFAESVNGVRTEKFQESLKFNFERSEVNHFSVRTANHNYVPEKITEPKEKKNLHSKCSFKNNGVIKAYSAITDKGIVRKYNEDRVTIILNVMKPKSRDKEKWPKCSFFGIYDGHGGAACADFLRDHLHHYVVNQSCFPYNVKEAIQKGFFLAEKDFIDFAKHGKENIERSGSCAVIVLIIGDTCYVANVGDSRAILSKEKGKKLYALSRDHKPNEEKEKQRILNAGGKIYQAHCTSKIKQELENKNMNVDMFLGPFRVYPGKLSVSRTFGDIEAKLQEYGGNPNVIISEPEIKCFKISSEDDFIIFGSDGIFDRLSSRQVVEIAWKAIEKNQDKTIHNLCGVIVENIVEKTLERKSLDNVTAVMICFSNLIKTENILTESKKANEKIKRGNIEDDKKIQQKIIENNTKNEKNDKEKHEKNEELQEDSKEDKEKKRQIEIDQKEKEEKLIRKYLLKKLQENTLKKKENLLSQRLIVAPKNNNKENMFLTKSNSNIFSSRLNFSKFKKYTDGKNTFINNTHDSKEYMNLDTNNSIEFIDPSKKSISKNFTTRSFVKAK